MRRTPPAPTAGLPHAFQLLARNVCLQRRAVKRPATEAGLKSILKDVMTKATKGGLTHAESFLLQYLYWQLWFLCSVAQHPLASSPYACFLRAWLQRSWPALAAIDGAQSCRAKRPGHPRPLALSGRSARRSPQPLVIASPAAQHVQLLSGESSRKRAWAGSARSRISLKRNAQLPLLAKLSSRKI